MGGIVAGGGVGDGVGGAVGTPSSCGALVGSSFTLKGVGIAVGLFVTGGSVGLTVGLPVGLLVGSPVGLLVGSPVVGGSVAIGDPVGDTVGVRPTS